MTLYQSGFAALQNRAKPASTLTMSKQLLISAAASTFALAALALLAPGSAGVAELPERMGATISVAAPLSVPQVSAALDAELLSALD